MKAILPLCLLVCVPQISSAQVNAVTTTIAPIKTDMRVLAEVIEVERHPEGDPKYSLLRIESIFRGDDFRKPPAPITIKVRHAHRDFELFEGEHVLDLKKTYDRGEWYLERSSHGETVDAAERQRQADSQRRKEEAKWCRWPVERELCYQKIKMAYDAEVFVGSFQLDDTDVCERFIPIYDAEFRISPRP